MKFSDIKSKIESLNIKKKILLLVLLIIIFSMLAYLASMDVVKIVDYKKRDGTVVCSETYINGVLNGTPCNKNNGFVFNNSLLGDAYG
jgi:hypothetical protein